MTTLSMCLTVYNLNAWHLSDCVDEFTFHMPTFAAWQRTEHCGSRLEPRDRSLKLWALNPCRQGDQHGSRENVGDGTKLRPWNFTKIWSHVWLVIFMIAGRWLQHQVCVFLSLTKLPSPGSKVLILFFGLPVHNFLNGEFAEWRSGKTVCVSVLYSSSPCSVRLWSICGRTTCANFKVYLRYRASTEFVCSELKCFTFNLSVCLSIYLSVCLSLCLSTSTHPSVRPWLHSPCAPWPLFQFHNLYTVCMTPWTGDQPAARPLPTHRTTQT
jgi:hypothetical protein